jgi:hypothetical protein
MSNVAGFTRLLALTLAASVAVYAGACSSDADPSNGPEGPNDIDWEGVVYVGGANDEGLRLLLDAPLKASPVPLFTSPEAGTTLEAPTTFSYHAGEEAELKLLPRGATPQSSSSFARELAQLVGRERRAFAHGAPMNGPGYLLTFASVDDPKVLRVFTDQTTYLPDEAEWQALVAATDDLTVSVRLAVFDEGRLASGGGPFESAPLAFSIVVP